MLMQANAIQIPLKDNCIDCVVTDPPYELGFMGKKWDSSGVAFQIETWKEVLRVVKPGAMMFCFGGTRTHHRLMCAIEDAGFEIRDCLMWLYGSGFPKSLDISKAIDKAGVWNHEFDEVRAWLQKKVKEKGLTHKQIDEALGNVNSHLASHYLGQSQPMLPNWDQWLIIKKMLGVDEDIDRPPRCIGYERAIIGFRNVNRGVAFTSEGPNQLPITIPATHEAQAWDGQGTALKPAWEPIILAMKPLDGTFAQNALKWGVGGLNIDAGRIDVTDKRSGGFGQGKRPWQKGVVGNNTIYEEKLGRWPANVILDEEAAEMLDGQSGITKSTGGINKAGQFKNQYGDFTGNNPGDSVGGFRDSGGASRFFYCAKASRAERNAGLGGEAVPVTNHGATPRKYEDANWKKRNTNYHPTVKPLALIEYLVRLGSRPSHIILDPFIGSGTTIIACDKLNRTGIGLDLSYTYLSEIAKPRQDVPLQRVLM